MIYEAYEARMQKIANIIATIKKYRVLIISVLCAILALISTFLGVRGMITEDASAPSETFTYGTLPEFGGKALFGKVSYEFKFPDSEEWTEEEPFLPGKYSVRAVSRRTFGVLSYGEPFEITMLPKSISISVNEDRLVYGDKPTASALGLISGDTVQDFDYQIADKYALLTSISLKEGTVKIVSSSGVDVSSAYALEYVTKNVTVVAKSVTVTFGDASKVYDGLPLSNTEFFCSEGSLISGDLAVLGTAPDSVTDYRDGGYENVGTVVFTTADGKDISHMYAPVYVAGRLTVEKRPIELTSSDASKVFDGERLNADSHTVSTGSLAEGQTTSAVYTSNAFYAGEYENTFEASVVSEDGTDLTHNYSITYKFGSLNVGKRTVRIKLSDRTWIYDGRSHNGTSLLPAFAFAPAIENEGIVDGYDLEVVTDGSIVDVGETESFLASFTVTAPDGTDATGSFDVDAESGVLKVVKRPVVFTAADGTAEYNGKIHTGEAFFASHTSKYGYLDGSIPDIFAGMPTDTAYPDPDQLSAALADGHIVSFVGGGGGKTVGRHEYYFKEIHIADADGNDVTENYSVEKISAMIVIFERSISVTSSSESFVYDGTDHIAENINTILSYNGVVSGASPLCEGHTVSVETEGSIRYVGYTENTLKRVIIRDENGEDVTVNYLVDYRSGTLEVTKRPITVTMRDSSWVYDGFTHAAVSLDNRFSAVFTGGIGPAIVEDGVLDVISIGQIRNVGTQLHSYDSYSVTGTGGTDLTTNYDITVIDGSLTVTPKDVTFSSGTLTKTYDGSELIYHEYEIVSGGVADTDTLRVVFKGTITDVGSRSNDYSIIIEHAGENINYNYNIETLYGNLTVTKRPIEISGSNASFVYDGNEKNGNMLDYTVTGATPIVDGHQLIVRSNSAITDVGSIVAEISSVTILDSNGQNVTANYDTRPEWLYNGSITVTKRPVLVVTSDISKIYDGTPLYSGSNDSIKFYYAPDGVIDESEIGLCPGEQFLYDSVSITYVKETGKDNYITVISVTKNGADKFGNYEFSYLYGKMSVTRRDITLAAKDYTYIYNGKYQTPPTEDQFEVIGYLGAGDPVVSVVSEGKIKNAGSVPHVITSYLIKLPDGEDITDNFNVDTVDGTVIITKKEVVIYGEDAEKIYDGTPLVFTGHTSSGLVEGHLITEIRQEYLYSDVGNYTNELVVEEILDELGESSFDNYFFTYDYGNIRIISGILDVITYDAEQTYNGMPLTNSSCDLFGDTLTGHNAILKTTGSRVNAGSVANTYVLTVTDQYGTDVTEMYTANEVYIGTLTVNPRPLYTTSANAEKIYDGYPLTAHSIVGKTGLVDGHYIDGVEYYGEQTEPGVSSNEYLITLIRDAEGNDVTLNYDFVSNCMYGKLTVIRGKITVYTGSGSWEYDGSEHGINSAWHEGDLLSIHTADIVVTGSIKHYGVVENAAIIRVLDIEGNDVTSLYEVVPMFGSLEITKRPITVASYDKKWIYDGSEHFFNSYYVYYDGIYPDGLVEGDSILSYDFATITEIGSKNNEISNIVIENNGIDVTSSYDISYAPGTLTVISGTIELEIDSVSETYNGMPHFSQGYNIAGDMLSEHAYYIDVYGSLTDVGSVDNAFTFYIYDIETGEDVTALYNVNIQRGTIEVTKRPLKVISASDQRDYNGQPLENHGFELVENLVPGHEIAEVEFYSSITDYGTVDNEFAIKLIVDEFGVDVTENYEIDPYYGTLSVAKRMVSIESATVEKIYDGTPLRSEAFTLGLGGLVKGHLPELEFTESITEVGSKENLFTYEIYDSQGNRVTDNYAVEPFYGYLRVVSGEITISTGEAHKDYDGLPLENHVVEWNEDGMLMQHSITVIATGSQTMMGSSLNTYTYVIVDIESGNVVQSSDTPAEECIYTIIEQLGTLTVGNIKLTVSTESASKRYDGTPLTKTDNYEVLPKIQNHRVELIFTGSQTEVGESMNTAIVKIFDENDILIFSSDDPSLESIYEIETFNWGTLKVIPSDSDLTPIIVKSKDLSKLYDGKPFDASEMKLEIASGSLPDGYRIEAVFYDYTNLKFPFKTECGFDFVQIFDGNGTDVTSDYDISKAFGIIEIKAHELVINTEGADKIYDGTPLTNGNYDIIGDFLEGHYPVVTVTGSQTYADSSYNSATLEVYDEATGENVTYAYHVTENFGELLVKQAHIVIHPYYIAMNYTGSVNKYTDRYSDPLTSTWIDFDDPRTLLNGKEMPSGHVVYAIVDGEAYEPNSSSITRITEYSVFNSDGIDVTESFIIEAETSVIDINPVYITITSASATKKWDASKLTKNSFEITEGALISGHKITVNITGRQISPGSSANTIESWSVVDENGVDVTSWYEVTPIEGTLTVT